MNTTKHILILAGTSDIGFAIAQHYLSNNYKVTITGRDKSLLATLQNQLKPLYKDLIESTYLDVIETKDYTAFFNQFSTPFYGIICCVGYLGKQDFAKHDSHEANRIERLNFLACKALINASISKLSNQGFIIGITSVAGDRLKPSNYNYGSAKAKFSKYLKEIRLQLKPKKICVLDVKPGFVNTKMTAHLELPKPLTATPQQVATAVYSAQQKKKHTVYVLGIWKYIMMGIKMLPKPIFKALNL